MPVAIIHILEGRPPEKKRALIAEVSQAISHALDAPLSTVRVLVSEVPSNQWGVGGIPIADRDG